MIETQRQCLAEEHQSYSSKVVHWWSVYSWLDSFLVNGKLCVHIGPSLSLCFSAKRTRMVDVYWAKRNEDGIGFNFWIVVKSSEERVGIAVYWYDWNMKNVFTGSATPSFFKTDSLCKRIYEGDSILCEKKKVFFKVK